MTKTLICDVISEVIIVAYKEDTERLESAFCEEGLVPRVMRRSYSVDELSYSQSMRVLLSHLEAWKLCSIKQSCVIICEADFVPCRGFGRLQVPMPPAELRNNTGIAWLYACGPTVYHMEQGDSCIYARGHCAAPVAIFLTPIVAKSLCEFGFNEAKTSNPYSYSTWDTRMTAFLKGKNIKSYLSVKNFGEHGGIPNSEHRERGQLPATHRADSLIGRLHFLPLYARGSLVRFHAIRFKAKAYGMMRLLFFRLIRLSTLVSKSRQERMAMIAFVIDRMLSWY